VVAAREADADAFYAALAPAGTDLERMRILRQACAGLVWSKQTSTPGFGYSTEIAGNGSIVSFSASQIFPASPVRSSGIRTEKLPR